jgi:hypothetical protein
MDYEKKNALSITHLKNKMTYKGCVSVDIISLNHIQYYVLPLLYLVASHRYVDAACAGCNIQQYTV